MPVMGARKGNPAIHNNSDSVRRLTQFRDGATVAVGFLYALTSPRRSNPMWALAVSGLSLGCLP